MSLLKAYVDDVGKKEEGAWSLGSVIFLGNIMC
jgi:hypothetical protein